jgi:uncharacterized protein DUF955
MQLHFLLLSLVNGYLFSQGGFHAIHSNTLPLHESIDISADFFTNSFFKALIQLSSQYETEDQFWFTFFHETGHILLHGKRQFFIDVEIDPASDEQAEKQANNFAREYISSLT